jgi:cell division protein FtsL
VSTTSNGPRRLIFLSLIGLASFAVASTGMVWVRIEVTSKRYELQAKIEQRRALVAKLEALDVEVQRLSTAARIEPLARNLGLAYPEPGQVEVFAPRAVAFLEQVPR